VCCTGGCSRAAPPPRRFAILLLTGDQRGAAPAWSCPPRTPHPYRPPSNPPTTLLPHPTASAPPSRRRQGPFLLTSITATSHGQGCDGDGSARGLRFQNNIHYHIHSVFISQMYGSVTMEKKGNSEFVLKRYSN